MTGTPTQLPPGPYTVRALVAMGEDGSDVGIQDANGCLLAKGLDWHALAYFCKVANAHDALAKAIKDLMVTGSTATGYLMCDFSDMHAYIKQIMGRPVWMHEMGDKNIAAEIAKKAHPDFIKAIDAAVTALGLAEPKCETAQTVDEIAKDQGE